VNFYVPIICFVAGIVTGVIVTITGFRLGFRSSYEIRNYKEEPENRGLFTNPKDPAEFELLEDTKED